ncbi:hypothetical protein NQ317_015101 [Molorchus minor]|uniref:Peroxidase n=1 Tax=Molorchus minor TaxID=1323400 RepID=A0ABQ9K4T3_9CUCU|nr:hypothetical protein NQ317_015101 [Molorchus minor]
MAKLLSYSWLLFLQVFVAKAGGPLPEAYNVFLQRQGFQQTPVGFQQNQGVFQQGAGTFQPPTPGLDLSGGNKLIKKANLPILKPQQTPLLPSQQDLASLGCGSPPANCPRSPYRSFDGSCNNLRNPVLGTPNTPYTRLLPPNYADGKQSLTLDKSASRGTQRQPLPGARTVSVVIYPDQQIEDPIWSLNAMQYGQIITHDMSMIAGSTQAQPQSTMCCSATGQLLELASLPDHCFPIVLDNTDPAFGQVNAQCMNFVRTITDRDRNCVGGNQPAEQLTAVNHYLDLSIVYGNDDLTSQQLRQFQGGRLRVDIRGNQQWPPRNLNATGVCAIQNIQEACYLAGDTRVNQNPQLTVLQVVLLREHNRIADTLGQLNPHWDDETIFQEARKINIGQHQHISYYEWLPIFIGLDNSLNNRIVYTTKDFVDDYDINVNPTILNEHATAAFRYFHSLIAGNLDLVTENRNAFGSLRLSDWFNRPQILEEGDNFDDLSRGLNTQPQMASDPFHDSEITQFLFRAGQPFGQDLKAIDIQRNRDHGLASYNDYRTFCGLPRAQTFEDFLDVMRRDSLERLINLYERPDDVDLTVGGSLEAHVPGTLAGPTFLCILTEQFYRTRVGDRFWFENSGETGFTRDQLSQIRKASISRLLCDNGRNIQAMQPRGFERISARNAILPCEALPRVDLSFWRDPQGPGVGQDQVNLTPQVFF